jgi:hypothetical protein
MAEESSTSSGGKLPEDKGKGKQVDQGEPDATPKQQMEKTDPKDVEKMLKSLGLGDMLSGAVSQLLLVIFPSQLKNTDRWLAARQKRISINTNSGRPSQCLTLVSCLMTAMSNMGD